MEFVKIDPPGTFCFNEAVLEIIQGKFSGRESHTQFIEVGCGGGGLSKVLCEKGYVGAGIDFSKYAIQIAKENLSEFIESGMFRLINADFMETKELTEWNHQADLVFSMMVMEHVKDEGLFIENLLRLVKPGGYCLLAVPGRKDHWGYEDETVGHLRRYDNDDLKRVMEKGGLAQVEIWSVGVPVVNLLYGIGNFIIKRSDDGKKREWSTRQQTEASGIREIPFKTVFPSFFKIILNRVTLYPLFILQRIFYNTNLGLTMLGIGKVKE
jgi:SAM-dependent methyltransferase